MGTGLLCLTLAGALGIKKKYILVVQVFLALISSNMFVLFTYFSAGQDLGTLMCMVPASKL